MVGVWLIWLCATVYFDFKARRVPNWLVLSGLAFASIALSTGRQPFELLWTHALIASLAAFLFFLVFYAFKVMGAGDVKFAGVLALWVGLTPFTWIWLMASVLAGLHAALFLVSKRQPLPFVLMKLVHGPAINDPSKFVKSKQIPYAGYLALSAIAWLLLFKQTPGS
ncbi:A24 family peptidase [Variovorax ginsengisoli]|uniref:Prepilin peptidase CpaA n=1 Tax=Variovorax ginsengisoli TaxID=363844 RepID=A0ABT9SEC3_9BURK|nr:prepilin peptidase [Variovorax ginsengisoli]MDP9902715.1 prepilin peptidase CpaA [Variovorax ginsengisoli]